MEERPQAAPQASSLSSLREEFRRDAALENVGVHGALVSSSTPYLELDSSDESEQAVPTATRLSTGIGELDRVLGGGMVRDSFILLGGDPGIGKSTLLLQMAHGLLEHNPEKKILYVSGEESIEQIRSRAKRLGVSAPGRIFLAAETQLEKVFASVKELKPDLVAMDSLQTFSSGFLDSPPGSVSQVREVTARLMALAKSAGIAVWLVGHVTKEGSIAGPKVVEHMVDTVLYFEGEGGQTYRLLRTVKNRFGSTRELGVFEMDGEGLREVSNPSELFLTDRDSGLPGVAIAASLEGSRPLLVELQALVAPSGLAVPRRTAVGMDSSRVALISAILDRHVKVRLNDQDLFFNVAGGLKLNEPACDLAAAAAIWSSRNEVAFPGDCVWIGELGLTGEVRRVPQLEVRLQEAHKLGFKKAVVPQASAEKVRIDGLTLYPISRISELSKLVTSWTDAESPGLRRPSSGKEPRRASAKATQV